MNLIFLSMHSSVIMCPPWAFVSAVFLTWPYQNTKNKNILNSLATVTYKN